MALGGQRVDCLVARPLRCRRVSAPIGTRSLTGENSNANCGVIVLITSAFLNNSCAPSAATDNRAADAAAIQALDEQWSTTAARNDVAGTVAFYADDAVLLPPDAPIAKDPKSIRESWAALLGSNTMSWKASKVEVAKSGELGYLYGTYQLSIKDPQGGPTFSNSGKLVEIWKRQSDGKWKCIVDTYNSDVPPAPEAKK